MTLIVIYSIVLIVVMYVNSVVRQVVVVSRHCDRTSAWSEVKHLNKYPSTTDITEILNTPQGSLTPLGQKQCYHLGSDLFQRYSFVGLINGTYSNVDYNFNSSPYQRTLMSAFSVSLALFPNFAGRKVDVDTRSSEVDGTKSHAWKDTFPYSVGGEQGAPYFSTLRQDSVMLAQDLCQKVLEETNLHGKTARISNWFDSKKDVVQELVDLTGNPIGSAYDLLVMLDYIMILHFHQVLPQSLENNIGKYYSLMNELNDVRYNRNSLTKLGGSKMMQSVLKNQEDFVKAHTSRRYIKESAGEYKFIHYSAHDSTLTTLMVALNLQETFPITKGIPPYGSAFIFELHEDGGKFSVQTYYKRAYDGDFSSVTVGTCENKCAFSKFKSQVEEIAIEKNWCAACGGEEKNNECLQEKVLSLSDTLTKEKLSGSITFFAVSVFVVFLFFIIIIQAISIVVLNWVFCGKKNANYIPVK